MIALLRIILAGAWKPIAWLFGGLILRWQIRRGVKQETALEAAEAYAKTRKAMDDEAARIPDDDGVLREWLQHRDPGTK